VKRFLILAVVTGLASFLGARLIARATAKRPAVEAVASGGTIASPETRTSKSPVPPFPRPAAALRPLETVEDASRAERASVTASVRSTSTQPWSPRRHFLTDSRGRRSWRNAGRNSTL
jgi:hypothetical protein